MLWHPHFQIVACQRGHFASSWGFDDRCDIFSLGIVAHQLFTGDVPYKVAYAGGKSYGPVDYEATRANMEPGWNGSCSCQANFWTPFFGVSRSFSKFSFRNQSRLPENWKQHQSQVTSIILMFRKVWFVDSIESIYSYPSQRFASP